VERGQLAGSEELEGAGGLARVLLEQLGHGLLNAPVQVNLHFVVIAERVKEIVIAVENEAVLDGVDEEFVSELVDGEGHVGYMLREIP